MLCQSRALKEGSRNKPGKRGKVRPWGKYTTLRKRPKGPGKRVGLGVGEINRIMGRLRGFQERKAKFSLVGLVGFTIREGGKRTDNENSEHKKRTVKY